MSLFRSALVAVVLLSVLTGCEVECETNQDCPSGEFRCVNNACVLPDTTEVPDFGFAPQIDIGFPDVPDLGFPDRGVRDLGPNDGRDAGDAGDTGADGGDAGDTGAPPSPLNDIEALVQVGIIRFSPDVTGGVAEARLLDYSQSGRTIEIDPPRPIDGCVITRRGPGTPAGFEATRLEATNGVVINMLPVTMPMAMPGVYRSPNSPDPAQLIQPGAQVSYRIVSTGAMGTLGALTTSTPLPPAVLPLSEVPAPGSEVTRAIINIPNYQLAGANAYEVYDADRRKVIECPITPATQEVATFIDGEYPSGDRVTLIIRSDAETTVSVPVVGRGSIPVTFRATRGIRFRLIIP